MSKLFTNFFKTFVADKLKNSNTSNMIVLGRHISFADELNPPTAENKTVDVYTGVYDNAIVGMMLQPSNVQFMIPRVDWSTGAYNAYRHDSANGSYVGVRGGTSYDVFKCLANTNGWAQANSTVPPAYQFGADDIYETSDGYRWKYMYSISLEDYANFATADYIPVFSDATVKANAVDGSIDFVSVVFPGSSYNTVTGGSIQAAAVGGNTYQHVIESTPSYWPAASTSSGFYNGATIKITSGPGAGELRTITDYTVSGSVRTIGIDSPFTTVSTTSTYEIMPKVVLVGSGTGFEGRALVNTAASNSIYKVDIVNHGSGYYYATATIQGNTGGVSNTATILPMIGPKGGHGYDPITELGGKYLCFATTIDSTELTANTKSINTNDFRTVSLINSPLLANVMLTITSLTGVGFSVGETITQAGTGATGKVVSETDTTLYLTNVSGSFLVEPVAAGTQYAVTGGSSLTTAEVVAVYNNGSAALTANVDYVNMTTRVSIDTNTGTFGPDDMVSVYDTSNNNVANATVYFANTSQVWLTNMRGTITGGVSQRISSNSVSANVATVTPPDILYGSGKVHMVDNILPINRMIGQTETIKVIIEF